MEVKWTSEDGKDEIKYEDCLKKYIFGEHVYKIKTRNKFPVIIKMLLLIK